MDERSIEVMTTEDIETEVIAGNPVLTLITTEDGIPTSTEVTVLTTALGDVPLMTTLGTLTEVPLVTTHPTFVTSHPGMSTVYSIAPAHQGQAVMVDGRIAVMDSDGVRQTIVVHADPSQLSSALAHAQVQHSVAQNIMSVSLDGRVLEAPTRVILTEQDGGQQTLELDQETNVLQDMEIDQTQVIETVSTMEPDENVENVTAEPPAIFQSTQPLLSDEANETKLGPEATKAIKNESDMKPPGSDTLVPETHEETETVAPTGPPAPLIPEEVVCLVCYQSFLNPNRKKLETSQSNEEEAKSTDTSDKGDENNPLKDQEYGDICYGRTLGRFFELSRINMSIVTRRSYKEYEVPICLSCNCKLIQAEKILAQLKQLEKDLYVVRQRIKDEVLASYNFYKNKENQELAEGRKKMPGLLEILEIVDRIREDIIHDGRPPRIPRSVGASGRPGRKPTKSVKALVPLEDKQSQSKPEGEDLHTPASAEPQENVLVSSEIGTTKVSITETPNAENKVTSDAPAEIEPTNKGSEPVVECKVEKPALRTSFGRLIKRPSYMINDLTEDELSELGESSEEEYEEIEVKPEILTEGEPEKFDEDEIDEEDPAWSPGRGTFISEKVGILTSSSDDSDALTDVDSDAETSLKSKPKKDIRRQKSRKSKSAQRKHPIRRSGVSKQEHVNYEVKVIQMDGTELMSINTTSAGDNIGLEPDITQKVMDSQAVIMVKNQLFGKRVQCPHCTRTFTDVIRKDIHVKKKHEGVTKPFECDICQKRFARQDHLRNHMKRHSRPVKDKSPRPKPTTGDKNQTCEFCDQRFRNKSELSIHIRLHTGEKPFKCESCSEAFVSALKREFHIEQMHPEVAPLRCDYCPKGFFRQHRLKIHGVTHTGEKTNICEICGKCFSQAAMLRYHQTTHEELNLKQFKCKECNRVFANPQNLKSHMESQHQKMYRHRCDTCGRGYTQMSHLRRHLRTHSGEQPFACSYCPKKFTSGAALKIHARIHTGERPYWCSQCEKGFRSKTKLGRHLKTLIHSGENKGLKKDATLTTAEIETLDVNAASSTTWTEIVGIITGV